MLRASADRRANPINHALPDQIVARLRRVVPDRVHAEGWQIAFTLERRDTLRRLATDTNHMERFDLREFPLEYLRPPSRLFA